MTKRLNKENSFIISGVIIIFCLILSIVFIINLRSKKSPSTTAKGSIQIYKDYSTKTLDLTEYKTDQGKIKKVDTAIKPITDQDYQYANLTNNFKTFFSQKIDPSKDDIKIQREDSWITFSVINNLTIFNTLNNQTAIIDTKDKNSLNFNNIKTITSADNQKNRIKYTKIYEKDTAYIDVVYTITNKKLSEEMILNKFLGFPQISQTLKLNNVYPKIENKQISFYSQSTHKLLWFIPQPKMYELKNQKNESNGIEIQLECIDSSKPLEKCNTVKLTKTINQTGKKWLSDSKRIYPVVIDPAFEIDDADTAASWVSSDATYFSVSGESTIKIEGTGSVKIGATATSSFWSTNGTSADAACTSGSTNSHSIYTACGSPYECSSGYWNDAGCVYGSYSSGTFYSTCTGYECDYGYTEWYAVPSSSFSGSYGTGSCTDGVNPCYRMTSTSTAWTGGNSCGTDDCVGRTTVGTPTACSWTSGSYLYPAASLATKYTSAGTCTNGVNPCYKLTGSYASYVSGTCGGGSCTSSGTYYDRTACTWTTIGSLDDTATLTESPAIDLSSYNSITFWVRSSRTGTFMQLQIGETGSSQHTFPFTIDVGNTWEQKTWDISSIGSTARDAITKIAFKNTDASSNFTFYFDDIQATVAPNIPTHCVIRESSGDTFLLPQWQDNSSDEDGFQLEKNTDSAGFSVLTNLAAGITGYLDNSISSSHTYGYRVRSYKFGIGTTDFSDYCTHPTLNLNLGNFKFEGIKMEGIKNN